MVLDSSIHARRQRGKRWNRIYSDGARGAGSLRGALTGNDARSASIIARFRGVPAPGGWRPSAANISVKKKALPGSAERLTFRCAAAQANWRWQRVALSALHDQTPIF
jgi:hypothetical protein